ncbi:MAG: nucleotidyltransferase family protein [Candidatus Dadabacteria bacterium]|nr:nucleotidyltransferase family protein [Candidatus Dadabacteria bacterium]
MNIPKGDAKNNYGGCWPTKEQRLLLQASLLQGNVATDAWLTWKSTVDLNNIDPGSYRLFPLLYFNLRLNGIEDPLMNIFQWVYRNTLNNNRMLFQKIPELLNCFYNEGIQIMLLKGASLTLLYYRDYGLRPMIDVDMLVHTEKALDAIKLLTKLGWRSTITPLKGFTKIGFLSKLGWTPKERQFEDFSKEYFSVRHAHDFINPEKFTIDLHWHLLQGYNEVNADLDFWDGAASTRVDNIPAVALNPTDLLLHVCAHGVRWNPVPPIRWIADAITIVNKAQEEINWDRMIALVKRHRLILPIKEALSYLKAFLLVPVPETVLDELQTFSISKTEFFEYRVRTRSPGVLDGLLELHLLYGFYSRQIGEANILRKIVMFPKFLQHVFGMDRLWHLILYVLFEFIRRIIQNMTSFKQGFQKILPNL